MNDRLNREETIFHAALQLAPDKRAAYLALACEGDDQLRSRIQVLLEAQMEADPFFRKEPLRVALGEGAAEQATVVVPITEKPGDRIGRYKLLQQIGEGGCGVVYMAEQEEPVRRRVALKVIKLGMDTKQVVGRFEAERQALALMDHPNIAKVLDAGATDTGRPYFVMELVRGVRITDYCDQNHLSNDERLKLFVQVCHAIQHAHQKGVIHRDIKPSNILVMLADDVPVPKVIDFGIAKAIGERLTDKTVYTRFEQFIGTPAYMSPEQAGLSGLDVDTRSDIYALGVLLYELLTGRTPFEPKELAQAGLDEIIRRIREEEPAKPSTRLSRLEEKERTTTAQRRATEAPKLIRSLRGDLDWIVMKCLEKNRTRRYETANELAQDIRCHLSHQPVSAAAPTLRYRTLKYVRRHQRVLATAAGFALLLMVGATLSVWQARRAGQAETKEASLRKVKSALETLPEIERQLEKDQYTAAFNLVEQARPFIGDNPRFQALAARAVSEISFETTPPGAEVYLREYNNLSPKWEPIGKSPVKGARLPQGFKRWKVIVPGYETAEGALFTGSEPVELEVQLDKAGTIAQGMVRIQGEECTADVCVFDWRSLPKLKLADFFMDRYEVTNRRFKEFVEAGGYQKPEYWKYKFVTNGVELARSAAMKLFVDQTGRPGPATWKDGDFPKGQEDYPVGGVSWYEAAAYAEWAGKRLPTVYHWSLAAGDTMWSEVAFITPLSNFGGKGPAPAGKYQGMTRKGIYDMAGNVNEWCFNETQDGCRFTAGGGWNNTPCTFGEADKKPPLSREPDVGFRCIKLTSDDGAWKQAAGPIQLSAPLDLANQKPCPDEVFQAYRPLYDYNKAALQPTNEAAEVISPYTRWERVSFNAATGGGRVIAHLFLPNAGKPPFQTVVHWIMTTEVDWRKVVDFLPSNSRDALAKSGRAFVMPVLRGGWPTNATTNETIALEDAIRLVKDYKRTLDYLETRPGVFDTNKLAYVGGSWGAIWGGILPAVEPRLKVAILSAGGLYPGYPEQCNQINFAPRIKIPILLQGGKYDPAFPLESSQEPYLKLFGTVDKDKQHIIYDTGHNLWSGHQWIKDYLEFLDKHLGPTN
jgi:serine/threonine protein kinase/formylglycine-generating enzyme required for sulfatase activity/dienelactone hydrolase